MTVTAESFEFMLSVTFFKIVMLSVATLCFVMLEVVMLSAVVLSVMALHQLLQNFCLKKQFFSLRFIAPANPFLGNVTFRLPTFCLLASSPTN
jgi:hypothetical protein